MPIFKKKEKPKSGTGEAKTGGFELNVNPPKVQSFQFYERRLRWINRAIEKWEGRYKDKPMAQRKLDILYKLKRKYEVLMLIAKGEI